jgi:nitrite reductase (NO-forming)
MKRFLMKTRLTILTLCLAFALVVSACQTGAAVGVAAPAANIAPGETMPEGDLDQPESPTVVFTLQTNVLEGRIVYVGVGGEIDGITNPDLVVQPGGTVRVVLVNGDGMPHDLYLPDFNVKTPLLISKGKTAELSFTLGEDQTGTYVYFCTQPGHRQAGQEGRLIVAEP